MLKAGNMELPQRAAPVRKKRSPARQIVIIAERFLLLAGVVLLLFVAAAYMHRSVMVRMEMQEFEKAKKESLLRPPAGAPAVTVDIAGTETTPIKTGVASAPRASISQVTAVRHDARVPLAILRIPKIHLEVPVLTGTDEITLNRGVGQIAGTAVPGEQGNIGIAGHRDGFFRNLKEINRGDMIDLETTTSSETYVVDRVLVTGPDDTSVLEASDQAMLTLVTCYPFHFVGPAPRRFVVQAHPKH